MRGKASFSNYTVASFILFLVATVFTCGILEKKDMVQEFGRFIKDYESKVVGLTKEYNLAYFTASISGKEEDYQKSADLNIKLSKIHANKEDFALLKKFKESNAITDSLLKRQLDVIYNNYLGNQIDEKKLEEMIKLQTEIERKFSTFRAEANGKKLTDNEIEEILRTSANSDELKSTWTASKTIGKFVSEDVLKLVAMRNASARELGFNNFHAMQLTLGEQDPQQIEKLFDELDVLTKDAFAKVKMEADEVLAKKYKIKKDQLMPWHYQNRFFQEAPKIYKVDLDKYFKDKDIVEITKSYYASIGLPIDDLIMKSDLFEKEGKYQHAYCQDMDKDGDVRVVCNVKPNSYWMNTLLHEYGHAVYDKFKDRNLPWVLRDPAHIFTTEAIAMLFGRFSSNPIWLHDVIGISAQEEKLIANDTFKSLRLQQLVFSRWAQVMYRFEKSMYENPAQDLNKLWWDLVEKYQMLKRPERKGEADWASKIHIATVPAYYHNYLMGELLASQLHYYIIQQVLKASASADQSFYGKKEVGQYLSEKIFMPGKRFLWNDMIKNATGEELTAKYFARQFVGDNSKK